MSLLRHPSGDQLLAVASGEADEPLRILVEVHARDCAACAGSLKEMTGPGAAMLQALPAGLAPAGGFDRLWAQVEALPPAGNFKGMPPEVAERLRAARLEPAKPWRWSRLFARGMDNLRLLLDANTGAALYLIHLRPGGSFPFHSHRGGEDALLLAGGCKDGDATYDAGDWVSYPGGSSHAPVGDPVEGCWILTRLEGDEVAFHGWRGTLQRIWEGIPGNSTRA
jgi:predicted ChrR family anti-sigma factor